jgi:hypothetical protein
MSGEGRGVRSGRANDDETTNLCAPTGIAIPIAPLQAADSPFAPAMPASMWETPR